MAEFPHVSLWVPSRMEGVVIASMEPLKIDIAAWQRRMSAPALRTDLEAIGFRSPEDIVATFVAADGALAKFVGDVPLITDDRPRVEYFNRYASSRMSVAEITAARESVEPYLSGSAGNLSTARELITSIWQEHEASATGRWADAQLILDRSLAREPGNQYLMYLRAAQKTHSP